MEMEAAASLKVYDAMCFREVRMISTTRVRMKNGIA
jgi:hypothetical protein